MQTTITAGFQTTDQAERAAARLRKAVSGCRVRLEGGPRGDTPADAPYTALIRYPYQPINYPMNHTHQDNYELGGRVLFTADILGLPIYRDGPTRLQVSLDEGQAPRARALLINAGGQSIHSRFLSS